MIMGEMEITAGTLNDIIEKCARALTSNPKFRLLCSAGLRRTSRSALLRHLMSALVTLSKHVESPSPTLLRRATAWLLKGCRTAIALRICDLVTPGGSHLERLISDLGHDSVDHIIVQEKRMKQFLDEELSALELYSLQLLYPVKKDGEGTVDDVDFDVDDGSPPPDLKLFADFSKVEPTLNSGPAFEEMYKRLRSAVFPSPFNAIKEELDRHAMSNEQPNPIVCIIDWHLLEYLKDERITIGDLESIFTITGEFENAHVARLGDYMSGVWTTGKDLLLAVKTLFAKFLTAESSTTIEDGALSANTGNISIRLFPSSNTSREEAYIKISGSLAQMIEHIEQLAWLGATLRPHMEGQLTVSDIDFRAERMALGQSSEQGSKATVFRLSLLGQDKTLQPDSSEPGQCWTSLFSESVLARGFPSLGTNRPDDALGLEIPFEIMSAFAGVKYPVLIGERMAFANNSHLLMAVRNIGDSIQWHFRKSDNWVKRLTGEEKALRSRSVTIDLAALVSSPAFLGYCSHSEILLGTSDFWRVEPSESGVPMAGAQPTAGYDGPISIVVDEKGRALASNGARWRFNRGEAAVVRTPYIDPFERFWQAARNSVLLYDIKSSVASLVPELSLVLQMASIYLIKESLVRRTSIPTATISADGGRAAYEAIERARDLTAHFSNRSPQRYIDIVASFLDVTEQRRTQAIVRRLFGGKPSRVGLFGWDHSDLQAESYEITQREFRLEDVPRPRWWDLFDEPEALVLFTKLDKLPIRNGTDTHGAFNCHAWDDIPKGKHLLITNMVQLECTRNDFCRNSRRFPTRYMLSDTLAWARPTDSRLFEHTCKPGGFCNPLQTMVKVDTAFQQTQRSVGGQHDRKGFDHHPGSTPPTGAVIFADDPSAFSARPCFGTISKKRSSIWEQSEQNYMFIAVSFAAFILFYWNFWFFIMSSALFGIAYSLS